MLTTSRSQADLEKRAEVPLKGGVEFRSVDWGRRVQDSVTEVGETRRGLTLALLAFAVLVLLPLGFDLPDPAALNSGMLM